jgi:hypothetical protein
MFPVHALGGAFGGALLPRATRVRTAWSLSLKNMIFRDSVLAVAGLAVGP